MGSKSPESGDWNVSCENEKIDIRIYSTFKRADAGLSTCASAAIRGFARVSRIDTCLRTIAAGPALLVWVSRETMNDIELRVKYINGANVTSRRVFPFSTKQ
jgi:hypothetical protein